MHFKQYDYMQFTNSYFVYAQTSVHLDGITSMDTAIYQALYAHLG